MREFLTGLAILVIGVLFFALVAPFFIDFNERRGFVEDTLSKASGTPIEIAGPISVRFLPFPIVKLEDVTVGKRDAGIEIKADYISLDIATMPLLKGEIHVMEAVVEKPRVRIAVLPDGRMPKFPQLSAETSETETGWAVRLETMAVHQGEIAIAPAADATPIRLNNLELAIEAAALSGPWHVEGEGEWRGRPVTLRLTTGAVDENGALRARATLARKGGGFKADLDGVAATKGETGFDGKLHLEGDMAWPEDNDIGVRPVSVSSTIKLAGRDFDITTAEILAGGDEGGFKLTGTGNGQLGREGRLDLHLDARQIDFDRTLALPGRDHPPLVDVLTAWRGILLASDEDLTPSLPVNVSLAIESVLAGGDTIRSVKLDAHLDGDGVKLKHGEADLPGGGRLVASGDIGFAEGGSFYGNALFTAKDFVRFGAWVDDNKSGHSPHFGEARDVSIDGVFVLSSSLIAASNLKINLDKSTLTGLVRYTLPEEGERARLDAQILSDGFDIDQLPDFPLIAERLGAIDASVLIDARNVRTTRVKDAHAGRVQMRVRTADDGLVIDTLDIADLGGASVKAHGRLTAAGEKVEAKIDAPDMAPLSILFTKLYPGVMTSALLERARSLSPLYMTLNAERLATANRTVRLSFDGQAAATKLSGKGQIGFATASTTYEGQVKINSPDAIAVLRQAGFTPLPLPLTSGAEITMKLKGESEKASLINIEAMLAGNKASAALTLADEMKTIKGPLSVNAPDPTPLLMVLGVSVPDPLVKLSINGSGVIDGDKEAVALRSLSASIAGRPFQGEMTYRPTVGRIDAALTFDALPLSALTSVLLGQSVEASSGSMWSSSRFPAMGPPPLDVHAALTIAKLETSFGFSLAAVKAEALWQPDSLEVSTLQGLFNGNPVSGSFALRRQGGLATYLGKASLKDVPLIDLFPRSGLGGTAEIQFDGGGSGESIAAFASSFAGGGQMRISSLTVPAFDIRSVANATKTLDLEKDAPDVRHVTDVIATGLNSAPLKLDTLTAPLTASSGVIRFGPLEAHQADHNLQGSLALDLRQFKIDGRVVIDTKEVPRDWSAPWPQTIVTVRGQIATGLTREIDATNLTNIFTTRVVARELARIEAQESDLRESTYFIRRLKMGREHLDPPADHPSDNPAPSEGEAASAP